MSAGGASESASGAVGSFEQTSVLHYYLETLRRRFWIVASCLLVAGTIGTVRAYRAIDQYESSARILVQRSQGRVMRFEGVSQDYQGWDPDFYSTQAGLVRSRDVLEMALEDPAAREIILPGSGATAAGPADVSLGTEMGRTVTALMGAVPEAGPEGWETYRGRIQSKHVPNSHFLAVTARGPRREELAVLVNAAADAYEKYSVRSQVEAIREAYGFLQREKQEQERKLREAEAALQRFLQTTRTLGPGEDGASDPVVGRLVAINEQLTQVQLQRIDLESELQTIRSGISSISTNPQMRTWQALYSIPAVRDDATLNGLQQALVDARKELSLMSETYGPGHPRYLEAVRKQDLLREQFQTAFQQMYDAMQNRLDGIRNRERELGAEYARMQEEALAGREDVSEQARLRSEVDRHRALFDALVQRLLELDISTGLVRGNVRVVERARTPQAPVGPDRQRMIVVAIVLGLVAGCGLAFFLESVDQSIRTPEELKERTGLPLLGFIPRMATVRKDGPAEQYSYRAMISLHEPASSLAEAYRHVRTSLFYSVPSGEIKVISLTSCSPREGKTTTGVNLALTISQNDKRVLMIDCDLHCPMLNRAYAAQDEAGLTDVLVGQAQWTDVLRPVFCGGRKVSNLNLISAGRPTPSPAELLGSEAMKRLLRDVRDKYDWVILDSPPVLYVSDASVIAAMSDGVIFVVKSGMGHRNTLMRAIEQLRSVKAHLIGTVLNDMVVSRMGRYYSYYYYHGYARYDKDYKRTYYRRAETASVDGQDGGA